MSRSATPSSTHLARRLWIGFILGFVPMPLYIWAVLSLTM